jgi:hypothetical protein
MIEKEVLEGGRTRNVAVILDGPVESRRDARNGNPGTSPGM